MTNTARPFDQRSSVAAALSPLLCLDCETYVPAGWVDYLDSPKCPVSGRSHRVLTAALVSALDVAQNAEGQA